MSAVPLRVRLASPTADPDGELPFRILVVADAAGRRLSAPLGQRQPIPLGSGGIAALLAAVAPRVSGTIDGISYDLDWSTTEGPGRAGCIAGIEGLDALERRRRDPLAPVVERALLAERIAGVIATVREQPGPRRLEALWRSLALLAEHTGHGVELALLPGRGSRRRSRPVRQWPVPHGL